MIEKETKIDENIINNHIIIEEAPLDDEGIKQDNPDDDGFAGMSFKDYLEQKRELYLMKGISEDSWRIHRQFLYIGNMLGLTNDEVDLYADPDFDMKQKEILLFLLFAKLINIETITREFLKTDLAAETMLVKLPILFNEESSLNSKKILDDAIAVYKDSVENYTKEKEHFEEQYHQLNDLFRKSEAECNSLRLELENEKKEEENLLNELDRIKAELEQKESVVNDLREESKGQSELEESKRKEEEANRIIEERAKQMAQDILDKKEQERREKEEIERAAIERFKRENNFTNNVQKTSNDSEELYRLMAMQQLKNAEAEKSKRGLFKRKKKKNESNEKNFYGFDLSSCIANAHLNNAQMQIISYAVSHEIKESILVNLINNDSTAEQIKGVVEVELAKRMSENKRLEREEEERHQSEVNDYGTYTQEDAKYGE